MTTPIDLSDCNTLEEQLFKALKILQWLTKEFPFRASIPGVPTNYTDDPDSLELVTLKYDLTTDRVEARFHLPLIQTTVLTGKQVDVTPASFVYIRESGQAAQNPLYMPPWL